MAHILPGANWRKCENKGCTEQASRKVMLSVTVDNVARPRLTHLCEGHAFLAFKLQPKSKITTCPCCETMFIILEPIHDEKA